MPIYKTSDVKTPNVTVAGSPTISNGVVSGFTTANYLTLPKTFNPQNNTWEIVSGFTTSDDIATDQGVLGGLGTSNGCTPFYVLSNNWIIFLSSDGSSWDIAKSVIVMPLSANTKYRCKVEFTGNEYICSSYNFANDEWEVKKTITSTSVIYGGLTQQIGTNRGKDSPFLGIIDLNESYININGSRWWSGMDYVAEKIKDICIAGQNTNCITHIPQDVKLSLSNGTLTLKAGSKVYVPNGFEKVTKYYKDVVTTKYWKEITTGSRELEYACYGVNNSFYYVKIPIDTEKKYYSVEEDGIASNGLIKASSSSELIEDTWNVFQSVTESSLILKNSFNLSQVFTHPRKYTDDLYIDTTTTTTVEGTPEDYTYTTTETTTVEVGADDDWTRSEEVDTTVKKFDEVVIGNDTTIPHANSSGQFLILCNNGKNFRNQNVISCYSGTTAPTITVQYAAWYDTANNKIKLTNDTGATWTSSIWSFPLCSTRITSGVLNSIDQVFNGFGYIGSVIFLLPNVRALVPNGRNADGSLENIEWVSNTLLVRDQSAWGTKTSGKLVWSNRFASLFNFQNIERFTSNTYSHQHKYNEQENQWYFSTDSGATWQDEQLVIFSDDMDITSGVISSITPKKVEGYTKPVHIDKIYKGSTLVYQGAYKTNQVVFEKATAGTYSVNLEKAGLYEITVVGGGGAAAMRGVYDDKGYGWGGGSGGAFVGTFVLERGTRTVVVGKANNNTTAQTSNSQTSNPSDTKTYGSSVSGVVSVGGGGSGHYNSSYVGAAGAAATLTITPTSTTLNKAGNAGSSGSGGKGSAAAATVNGGASVYNGYGKGQGCKTSEYYTKRSWVNGTAGYVKIVYKGRRP